MRQRVFLFLGGLAGGLAVLGGAFGAHALRNRLSERAFEIFELAIRYQMYHALALLAVGLLLTLNQNAGAGTAAGGTRWSVASGYLFVAGIVLFSGSLLVYSVAGVPWMVHFTPIGGLCWVLGWLFLAMAALRTGGRSAAG